MRPAPPPAARAVPGRAGGVPRRGTDAPPTPEAPGARGTRRRRPPPTGLALSPPPAKKARARGVSADGDLGPAQPAGVGKELEEVIGEPHQVALRRRG